jgi:hypothetical protein
MVEQALSDFAKEEGIDENQFYSLIQDVFAGRMQNSGCKESAAANRSLKMLVAAGDYSKFVSMMSSRARELLSSIWE